MFQIYFTTLMVKYKFNLKELHLLGNKITSLPDSIGKLSNLEVIN